MADEPDKVVCAKCGLPIEHGDVFFYLAHGQRKHSKCATIKDEIIGIAVTSEGLVNG